jgi:hypothetical protein
MMTSNKIPDKVLGEEKVGISLRLRILRSRIKRHLITYRSIFYGIFIILLFFGIWLALWKFVLPDDYVLDLSISISDTIQIFVIATALLGPLFIDYLRRRLRGPKTEVKFISGPNCVFEQFKSFSETYDQKTLTWGGNFTYFCLLVKNSGKDLLKNCEAVLSTIVIINDDSTVNEISVNQVNLLWLDSPGSKLVDINPEREYRVAVLIFPTNGTTIRGQVSDFVFHINDSADDFEKMMKLPVGTYIFFIDFYSSNAEVVQAAVGFDISINPIKTIDRSDGIPRHEFMAEMKMLGRP